MFLSVRRDSSPEGVIHGVSRVGESGYGFGGDEVVCLVLRGVRGGRGVGRGCYNRRLIGFAVLGSWGEGYLWL
eukprot:3940642-Rhodomonas_salina.1